MSRVLTVAAVIAIILAGSLFWPRGSAMPDHDDNHVAAHAAGLVVTNEEAAVLLERGFFVSREPIAEPKKLRKGEAERWEGVAWIGPDRPRLVIEPGPSYRRWGRDVVAVGDAAILDAVEAAVR
jgi:hypothetical protein